MRNFIVQGLLATVMTLSASAVMAWGYDGHKIAAEVATPLLSQKAKIRISELLQGGSLADVASYMDEERVTLKRSIPGSDKWHYINLPVCGSAQDSVCRNGDCATARIDQLSKLLADRGTDQATRIFAVKALVHLVADLANPLHAADNDDHGGNAIQVGGRSLHSEWDTGLVKKLFRGTSSSNYAAGLVARYKGEIKAAQSGDASSWAKESHELAVRIAYGALPGFRCGQPPRNYDRLPQSYYDVALPVVEVQLVKAGARIAFVFNQTLGE